MSEPTPYQPYIVWALGAAFFGVCAFVGYILRLIKNAGTEAEKVAMEVRAELLRAEIRANEKMASLHQENKERYAEAREDRNEMRTEIRQNHDTDLAQHAQMIKAIAELPMKVSEMLRERP